MEISDYIDLCMADCNDGHATFIETMEIIGKHPKLHLVDSSQKEGVFEISSDIKIIVSNKQYTQRYEPNNILKQVASVSGIQLEALKSPCRKREFVEARHAYFYINMELVKKSVTNYSLGFIGSLLNRNHSTVMHARKTAHLPSIQKIVKQTRILC